MGGVLKCLPALEESPPGESPHLMGGIHLPHDGFRNLKNHTSYVSAQSLGCLTTKKIHRFLDSLLLSYNILNASPLRLQRTELLRRLKLLQNISEFIMGEIYKPFWWLSGKNTACKSRYAYGIFCAS